VEEPRRGRNFNKKRIRRHRRERGFYLKKSGRRKGERLERTKGEGVMRGIKRPNGYMRLAQQKKKKNRKQFTTRSKKGVAKGEKNKMCELGGLENLGSGSEGARGFTLRLGGGSHCTPERVYLYETTSEGPIRGKRKKIFGEKSKVKKEVTNVVAP